MGSEDRMDFTVLGNNVNIGAWLCSSAKPNEILITHPVFQKLERSIETNDVAPISVKGIEDPIQVYQVIWEKVKNEVQNEDYES